MKFNTLQENHIKKLKSIVTPRRFSMGRSNLEIHSKDQSYHPASLPEAVLWPENRSEIVKILEYANDHMIPVVCWGAGSSVEGNPIPVYGGIVLDFSRMNRILDIREWDFQADVEPGVIYQDLNRELRHSGLFFPPDPGAGATIGGMLANNASGVRTVKYGSCRANLLRLTVVLANGETMKMGTRSRKTTSGYDMINLFVGSEGTLGVIVEATVRLTGLRENFAAALVTFPDVETAAKAVFRIMRYGLAPASLELLTPGCIRLINHEKHLGLKDLPTLFMEFQEIGNAQIQDLMRMAREICEEADCLSFLPGIEKKDRDKLLKARYEMAEMIMRAHPGRSHTVIDVAVPVSAYPKIIALADREIQKANIPGYIFGHAGDGNLHLAFMVNFEDSNERDRFEGINERIVKRAISLEGTATGEHGTGIGKRKFMQAEHGNSLQWMKKIKALFDPNGILNPGKIFP